MGSMTTVRSRAGSTMERMDMCQVTILPENTIVSVHKGTGLLAAAKEAGIDIASPCGGQGTCGKCAVRIVEGSCSTEENGHFPAELREAGYVGACQSRVLSDVTVEVPPFSRLTSHKVVLSSRKTRYSREHDYLEGSGIDPFSRNYYLELEPPTLDDSSSDLERIKSAFAGTYGLENLQIEIRCLARLPEILRKGGWKLTATVVERNGRKEIVDLVPGKRPKPAMGLAVDLGTTTVVVSLLDLENGKVLGKAGTYNKQASYGSDVISRIIYAEEAADGLTEMQKAAADTINELIADLAAQFALVPGDITSMVLGGNTVMTHFLYGIPASWVRLEPYVPGAARFPSVPAQELGIDIHPDAPVIPFPCVASYVGGDITAGVLATMLTHSEELTLFIDIGTNGELVLGNSEWMVACACSAGPAFEGSGISSGMRAMDGAIDRIEIDRSTHEVRCRTIGDGKPLGICGSGLIYALSEMMDSGIIDRAGQINEGVPTPRIRKGAEGPEYVLAYAEQSGSGKDITITGSDIKNLLRAKGAIFAGIRRMLQEVQLGLEDISRVYIAGGFGNYINITDAVNIGLLPDLSPEKFEYVGNSCIQGAMLALLSRKAFREAEEISGKMTYLELSTGNAFMEEFISALFIPHTDLSLFPSAGKRSGKD